MIRTSKLKLWILAVVLAGSSWLYLIAITPDRFGFYHDDGIYVVTAKALATGQGYRIISLPYEPAQTKYPPFYPFLLSLVWRVYPQFPENLLPMMLLSVLATIAVLALFWRYLVTNSYLSEWQALLVVALYGINWRTVTLAAGIYSEMMYATLSVAGLCLAERYEKEHWGSHIGILLGLLIGLAFLTRTSGIALLIAVVSYFIFRRQFEKSLLLLGVSGSFVLAWGAWAYVNADTTEGINAAFYGSYFRDFLQNVHDLKTLFKGVGTNTFMLIFISVPVVTFGLDYGLLEQLSTGKLIIIGVTSVLLTGGFVRHIAWGFRLVHFYVTSYLIIHIFWPYTAYDRFLMPILPLLAPFIIPELQFVIALVRKSLTLAGQIVPKLAAAFLVLGLMVLGGVLLYNHALVVHRTLASNTFYAGLASEDAQAVRWINRYSNPSDILACDRDPTYYLYTGRKAIRSLAVKPFSAKQGEADSYERAKLVFRIIEESAARYLILTSSDFEFDYKPEVMKENFKMLTEQYPRTFVPVFQCGKKCSIYRIRVLS